MIKSGWYYIISALFIFLLIGCAQWGGDNPLGITGGSKEGYGQNNDLYFPGKIDPELLGIWISYGDLSYETFTFRDDGTFTIEQHHPNRTIAGRWGVSRNELTLCFGSNLEVEIYRYMVSGNQLILYYGNEQLVLNRLIR